MSSYCLRKVCVAAMAAVATLACASAARADAASEPAASIDKFCMSASTLACSIFRADANECISDAAQAENAFHIWQNIRHKSNLAAESDQTILRLVGHNDYWLDLASKAPPGATATTFHSAVLQACLVAATQGLR